ncbi:MAG: thiolase family protein [Gordonia sp.]|jgi:acetyl-CoA acetyltransferase|uniref:thiolase family protein n=1 Tax=Gordonia sp. (in: high G+C Gram-positive bacteria) TaxID=84139 RepID=UPI001D1DAF99|nr:thiolase family protein [Gordonia sp. (in: high G+C Gram-positive bacteria)]MCB1297301.1 thiolase family protein [Gordonia sp. (in: high G+C Gram-positive bacteria)]HQV17752.1 thiolase family protein [Gordonia sp. (in: high G+C Gram-positive bacteria)]
MTEVSVIGVGMHPFGRFPGKSALDMGADALRAALTDAGISWSDVQTCFAGSLEVSNPDSVVAKIGLTGIPVYGVFNGCATANTSLSMAARAIEHGEADIAVAVGFDKHPRGAFSADPSVLGLPAWYAETGMFLTTHFFGMKINRYMHEYGITPMTLARVAAKNFRNGELNERAWRRTPMSEEDILAAPYLNYPLTRFMYCAPDEGAAAVVLCRADKAREYQSQPIRLAASLLRTRTDGAFEVQCPSLPATGAPSPTVAASLAAYELAGVSPSDVGVAQLQDTDAGSEVIHMAENGFCADGDQEKLIADGHTEIGGSLPVNTDGGLIANGEPIGASGLRQIHEVVLQMRGQAGNRQIAVPPRVGYTHLYGSPGTGAVSILIR